MQIRFFIGFLLILSSLCASDLETREGSCAHSSQIIFLEPPQNFSPHFSVSGCYCECQGKVLFLLRNPDKPQGSSWCIPGGKLQPDETPLQALLREVEEEIGVVLKEESVTYCRPVYVKFPSTEFVLHLFRTSFENAPPTLYLAWKENTDYQWVDYEEVTKLPLIPGGKECFCIAFQDKL